MTRLTRSWTWIVALFTAFGASGYTAAVDVTWINSAGGDWSDGANWDTGSPPGPGDVALITKINTCTVNLDVDATVAGLQVGGASGTQELIIDGDRTLTIDGPGMIGANGVCRINLGNLDGSGELRFAGAMTWKGGGIRRTGATIVEPTGIVSLEGSDAKTLEGVLENHGLIDMGLVAMNLTGSIVFDGGTLLNHPDGIIDIDPLSSFSLTSGIGVNAITNLGTFNKLGTAELSMTVPLSNCGTVTLEEGDLTIDSGTNCGMISVNGGLLTVLESPTTTPSFTNSGTIHLIGGNFEIPPPGPTTTPTLTNTGTITIDAGRWLSVNGGTFYQSAGTLDRAGDLIVDATLNWTGGLMAGPGRTLINPSGSLIVGGGGQRWLWGVIENHGLFDLGVITMNLTGSIAFYDATILNQPGGIINVDPLADFSLTNTAGVNAITNLGTFNKLGGAMLTTTVPFNNSGLVSVTGDELRINGGGSNDDQIDVLDTREGGIVSFGASYTHGVGSSITGDGVVQFLGGTHSIAGTFDTNRVVNIQTATLDLNAPYTFPVSLNVISGTLGGTGDFSVTGACSWTGGTMSGSGKTIIEPSGSLSISGPSAIHTLGRVLELRSPNCSWTGGLIDMANALIDIRPGAVLTAAISGSPTIQPTTCCSDTSVVNNAGTIIKTGTGSVSVAGTIALLNSGLIDVQNGIFTVRAGTNTNVMRSETGASLRFFTTFNHDPASSLTGPGELHFEGGTHNIACTLETNRTIEIDVATVNFNANYSVTGTIDVGNSGTSSTTIGGTGDLAIPGTLMWRAGIMTGTGRTIIEPGGTLTIYGSNVRTLRRILDNHSASASWTGAGLTFLDGTFNNHSDAILTIAPTISISFTHGGGANAFNNSGSFTKSGAGQLTVASGVAINNSGSMNLQQGVLAVAGSFIQTAGATVLDGGSLTKTGVALITKGGELGGAGTITGNVDNLGGTVAAGLSPGTITITGNYTQGSAGALAVELGGTTPGTQFDVLSVSGTASLAGTLEVSLIEGFDPTCGQTFQFLTAGSVSGTFQAVNETPSSLALDVLYGAASASIRILGGDMNCDNRVDGLDIQAFVTALLDPSGYAAQYPLCDILNADFTLDNGTTEADIAAFTEHVLTGACP